MSCIHHSLFVAPFYLSSLFTDFPSLKFSCLRFHDTVLSWPAFCLSGNPFVIFYLLYLCSPLKYSYQFLQGPVLDLPFVSHYLQFLGQLSNSHGCNPPGNSYDANVYRLTQMSLLSSRSSSLQTPPNSTSGPLLASRSPLSFPEPKPSFSCSVVLMPLIRHSETILFLSPTFTLYLSNC